MKTWSYCSSSIVPLAFWQFSVERSMWSKRMWLITAVWVAGVKSSGKVWQDSIFKYDHAGIFSPWDFPPPLFPCKNYLIVFLDFVIQKLKLQGLRSQMSNPSGVCSLWTQFVWFEQSFYKFRISCQHKQIWQFHIRLYISSFSWKSGICANVRLVYFLASMSLSWVVAAPLNRPHPHHTYYLLHTPVPLSYYQPYPVRFGFSAQTLE